MGLTYIKKNLLDAIAMEKEYRKLQTAGTEAKEAFGYHDKLKQFGFADTVEYERAKDIAYLKNTDFALVEIGASKFVSELTSAIQNKQETVFIVYPERLMVWVGTDGYNAEYCEQNNIPVREVGYSGGTIVTGPEDVAIGLLVGRPTARNTFAEILYNRIKNHFPNAAREGNDIIINGHKVFGMGTREFGEAYLATYQFTFMSYPEAIENICTKPNLKPVKGMSEIGTIVREHLVEEIKQWLQ